MTTIDAHNFWDLEASSHSDGVTEADIASVESDLGVKLPESFLALFRQQNGGDAQCNTYLDLTHHVCWTRVFQDELWPLQGLGTLQKFEEGIDFGGADAWHDFLDDMSLLVIIANHGSEWFTCLDYRQCGPQGEPSVVDIDAVSGPQIRHRVSSFPQLLAGLCEPSEDEFEHGFLDSQGVLFKPCETDQQDTPEFIATLLRLRERDAQAGDVYAMQELGKIYGNWNNSYAKQGYPVDANRSHHWFGQALQSLHAEAASTDADTSAIAMRKLGEVYQEGLGVAQDRSEAQAWYQAAADRGEFWGMLALARLLMGNDPPEFDAAERWALQAKAQWDVSFADDVLSALAHKKEAWELQTSEDDESEEEVDPQAQAEELNALLLAAEKGGAPEMLELAKRYAADENIALATQWYRRAADMQDDQSARGSSAAMAWLGYACVRGLLRDGSRDPVLGYVWYALACRERYNRVNPAMPTMVGAWVEFTQDQRDRIEGLLTEPQRLEAQAILTQCDAGPPHVLPDEPSLQIPV